MSLKKIIDAKSVNTLIKNKIINREGVRLIDCSYALAPRVDWKKFEKDCYGKFDNLPTSSSRKLYLSGHIPQAIHIDLDVAMYPSKYQRFAHYPVDIFEKYAQILGLNSGEHFIFYGKGAMGGMLFASKIAWLFKTYGHEKVSLVDGGFDAWKREKFEISQEDLMLERGNWTGKDELSQHVITFEELETKDSSDKQMIERSSEYNFLDSRGRGQFNGTEDTGLDPNKVNGTRIPGFKNFPSAELLQQPGVLKNEADIKEWLSTNGYNPSLPTITSCNSGVQAALLAYVMDATVPDSKPRLFNGSLKEVENRDPKKISEGPQHLPH